MDAAYLAELRAMVAEYGFLDMKEKKPGLLSRLLTADVRDAPRYSLELRWPGADGDGDSLWLNYHPTGAAEVEALMRGVAASLQGQLPEPKGAAHEIVYLSLDGNNPMAGHGYSYTLRVDDDDHRTLFSCDNYYDYAKKKIVLRDIAVDLSQMERLREIAAEHELVRVLRDEPDQPETRPDAPQYSLRIYLEEDAEGISPHYYVHYHPPGAEELLALFEEIANAYEELPTSD